MEEGPFVDDFITLSASGIVYKVIEVSSYPGTSANRTVRAINTDTGKEDHYSLRDWHRLTFQEIQLWRIANVFTKVFSTMARDSYEWRKR